MEEKCRKQKEEEEAKPKSKNEPTAEILELMGKVNASTVLSDNLKARALEKIRERRDELGGKPKPASTFEYKIFMNEMNSYYDDL